MGWVIVYFWKYRGKPLTFLSELITRRRYFISDYFICALCIQYGATWDIFEINPMNSTFVTLSEQWEAGWYWHSQDSKGLKIISKQHCSPIQEVVSSYPDAIYNTKNDRPAVRLSIIKLLFCMDLNSLFHFWDVDRTRKCHFAAAEGHTVWNLTMVVNLNYHLVLKWL